VAPVFAKAAPATLTLLAAVALALLLLSPAPSLHVTRAQGPAVRQQGSSPPFTALEDDYRRLRVGPFLAKITSPPLSYCIDATTSGPVNLAANAAAVTAAFETWDSELSLNLFQAASPITDCTGAAGKVQWASLGPGVVGQASLTFGTPDFSTKTIPITGFTIALNKDVPNWAVSAASGNYGVRDVLTHEAGHVLGLDDLNALKDMCLSMFRAAFTSDPRMQTPGHGDKLGAHAIYGGTPTPTDPACTS
jgi:hypothetical protein